jgi:DNA-directed RNA polymerase specialized sigma24 family protein
MDGYEPSTDAVDQLPALYARALRLRDAGLPDDDIAERIGVHPEAMDTVFRVAQAKLDRLR